ncbi:MAG: acyl carrier protein [Arenicellales bacterium]
MKEKLIELVREQLNDSSATIEGDSKFIDDLGMDSLDTVELVMRIEEEFGTAILDEDVDELFTVNDVVKYLEQN